MKTTLRLTKKMAHIFPPYIDVSFTLIPETWTRDWELPLLILNCDRAVWRSKELVKGMGQPSDSGFLLLPIESWQVSAGGEPPGTRTQGPRLKRETILITHFTDRTRTVCESRNTQEVTRGSAAVARV